MDYERFGPYTVYECLGAGGMARVHRASIPIGAGVIREVALKRLLPQLADDKQFVEDFIREAKLAAQLDHPNIVHILELGEHERTYFIAMELVRGKPLMQLLKQAYAVKQAAPIGVVVALLTELTGALEYAASGRGVYGQPLDIIHRDLTPSNLIVTDEGRLKIIDFGVAKALSGKFMTNTGLVKGKLGYMSPEALSGGKLDGRTDIFSIGVVAWELLTFRRLFRGINEFEVIMKIDKGEIEPPSRYNAECPVELDAIVLKALERPREDRWADATAMRQALDRVRRHYPEGATQVAAWKFGLIPPERPTTVRADSEADAEPLSTRDLILESPLAEGSVRKPSHTDLVVAPTRNVRDNDPTIPRTRKPEVSADEECTDVDAGIPDVT